MSTGYHESQDKLSERTQNMHRALASLMEELEAIDWYQQRVDATSDPALREILAHNRDEEIEHAAMVLEWLRRNSPEFDRQLRQYLFTSEPVVEIEDGAEQDGASGSDGSLGLGSLKGDTSRFTRRGIRGKEKDASDESSA